MRRSVESACGGLHREREASEGRHEKMKRGGTELASFMRLNWEGETLRRGLP